MERQSLPRVATPGDELYGKFLSPQEFAAAYGANQTDYAIVKKWAQDNGWKITQESISRTTVNVHRTAAQFEALFTMSKV
ncbi:MAG: protease pro-enzyme activation domain-containing protein [Chthoniobacterales bacterium]